MHGSFSSLKIKKEIILKKCEIELRLCLYVQELQGESKIRSQKVTVFNRQGSKAQFATTQFHQPSNLCVGKVK